MSVLFCHLLHHELRFSLGHLSLLPSHRTLCLASSELGGFSGLFADTVFEQEG
jgi:hypothetical protein